MVDSSLFFHHEKAGAGKCLLGLPPVARLDKDALKDAIIVYRFYQDYL
jgi:hypothetical protein